MLHSSTSGTAEHRKCPCIRLPCSLPQSAHTDESVLAGGSVVRRRLQNAGRPAPACLTRGLCNTLVNKRATTALSVACGVRGVVGCIGGMDSRKHVSVRLLYTVGSMVYISSGASLLSIVPHSVQMLTLGGQLTFAMRQVVQDLSGSVEILRKSSRKNQQKCRHLSWRRKNT